MKLYRHKYGVEFESEDKYAQYDEESSKSAL